MAIRMGLHYRLESCPFGLLLHPATVIYDLSVDQRIEKRTSIHSSYVPEDY